MENSERIFAIEDGTFEEIIKEDSLKNDMSGKQVLVFVEGKQKDIKGFLLAPDSPENADEYIEALKQYKITMK